MYRHVCSGLLSALMIFSFAANLPAIIISDSQGFATQGRGVTGVAVWDGVGKIVLRDADADGTQFEPVDDQWCTGTLINSNKGTARHILTAAHCLFDFNNKRIQPQDFIVNFPEPNNGIAAVNYGVQSTSLHPNFNLNTLVNDIALLTLGVDLKGVTTAYNINRPALIPDERANMGSGLVGNKVGFGTGGDGTNGATGNPAGVPVGGSLDARAGTKRDGDNLVELFGPVAAANGVNDGLGNLLTAPSNTLIYDFDDHVAGGNGPLDPAANAALGAALAGQFTGPSAAVGLQEVDTAPGDSGGPMFMFHNPTNQWLVVGVTSFGTDAGANPPPPFGSRFGDIAVDTRVQAFTGYVDRSIPEPASVILFAMGAALLGATGLRRREGS